MTKPKVKTLNLTQLHELKWAIASVIDYETDNSCGDPECCGGPFSDKDERDEGLKTMLQYGIVFMDDPICY